jgi:hypothetical protein
MLFLIKFHRHVTFLWTGWFGGNLCPVKNEGKALVALLLVD